MADGKAIHGCGTRLGAGQSPMVDAPPPPPADIQAAQRRILQKDAALKVVLRVHAPTGTVAEVMPSAHSPLARGMVDVFAERQTYTNGSPICALDARALTDERIRARGFAGPIRDERWHTLGVFVGSLFAQCGVALAQYSTSSNTTPSVNPTVLSQLLGSLRGQPKGANLLMVATWTKGEIVSVALSAPTEGDAPPPTAQIFQGLENPMRFVALRARIHGGAMDVRIQPVESHHVVWATSKAITNVTKRLPLT